MTKQTVLECCSNFGTHLYKIEIRAKQNYKIIFVTNDSLLVDFKQVKINLNEILDFLNYCNQYFIYFKMVSTKMVQDGSLCHNIVLIILIIS